MSLNTSQYIELVNSLITVMTSFNDDNDEAGEAYTSLKHELVDLVEAEEINLVFEMLVYIIALTKLALTTGHEDFSSFWRHYLLTLDEASESFLLGSCAEIEAILPHLRFLMTGEASALDDEAIFGDDEDY